MRVTVLGKQWQLSFCRIRSTPKNGKHTAGDCDINTHKIRVDSRLTGEEKLEVIIHELVHAAGWYIDETFVEQFGIDAARVLWRLGYREAQTDQCSGDSTK